MHDVMTRVCRWWWIIALTTLSTIAVAAIYTWTSAPLFVSSAKVYVSIRTQPDSTSLVQGSQFAQQQMASYVQVATSPLVLEPVIAKLNLPVTAADLSRHVTATWTEGTTVIALSVKGDDGRQSALIVNAAADELIKAIANLEKPLTSDSSPVRGTTVERGVVPTTAVAPKPRYNLGLGLLVGLLLGVLTGLAREAYDNRVHTRHDLTDDIGIPVLGALSEATQAHTLHPRSEIRTDTTFDDFRRICTNLHPRLRRAKGSTLMVTSTAAGEGKTTLVTGLAAAFAEDGSRVVVVDADLRTGALSRRLTPHATTGLVPVLDQRGPEPTGAVITLGGFDVLPAGEMVPNPSALLITERLTSVFEQLQAGYDVILVDSPSVDESSDATRLAPLSAITVLVANTHTTTLPAIRGTIGAIDSAGGHVVGAVINGYHENRGRPGLFSRSGHGRRSNT